MKAGIVGLGMWVPDEVRRNADWPDSFASAFNNRGQRLRADFSVIDKHREARPYNDLYMRHAASYAEDPFKGAIRRRIAPVDQPAVVGDSIAVKRALAYARVDPNQVNLVLSAALVPDRITPSNGLEVAYLADCTNAAGMSVDSVCSSAVSQLDIATALVESGRARFVACVQSHQIGRINHMNHPASPLFGDASAAFLVGPVADDRGIVGVVRGGDGSLAGAITFGYRDNPAAKWWRDASGAVEHGSEDIDSAHRIGNNLLGYPLDTIAELCEATKFDIREAAAICMIQPVSWFQAAVAEGLGVSADRVPSTHAEYAHIGAAGVTANLIEARQRNLLYDGAPVILYAHGAGLTRFAVLLRWAE